MASTATQQRKDLGTAAAAGDVPRLVNALLAGAAPDLAPGGSQTPLVLAAVAGHVECVRLLLDAGATPDLRNAAERTALMLAIEAGRRDVVELLLAHGASVHAHDDEGHSCAHFLFTSRDTGEIDDVVLDQLLQEGLNPNATDNNGFSVFMHALCAAPDTAALDRLLDAGASLTARDFQGCWAQHWASEQPDKLGWLLAVGADPMARDFRGRTPLHHCHRPASISLLVEHAADVNARDNQGRTPLLTIVQEVRVAQGSLSFPGPGPGPVDVIAALLNCGADLDLADCRGLSPRSFLAKQGQCDHPPKAGAFGAVLQLLLSNDAQRAMQAVLQQAPGWHGQSTRP